LEYIEKHKDESRERMRTATKERRQRSQRFRTRDDLGALEKRIQANSMACGVPPPPWMDLLSARDGWHAPVSNAWNVGTGRFIYPDMQPTRKALDAYVHLRRQRMRTATIERAAPCRESEASNSPRRLASSTHMRRDSYIREGLVPQMFISAGSVGCDVEPPIQVASRCWTHEGHR